jgi:hypothetical protein
MNGTQVLNIVAECEFYSSEFNELQRMRDPIAVLEVLVVERLADAGFTE